MTTTDNLDVRLLMLGAMLAGNEQAARIVGDAWQEIERLRREVKQLKRKKKVAR